MRKTPPLAALLALALLLVAACGGSDSGTSGSQTANPAGATSLTFAPAASPGGTGPTARPTRTANVPTGAPVQPCSIAAEAEIQVLIGVISDAKPASGRCTYTGQAGTLEIELSPEISTDAARAKVANFGATGSAVTIGDGGQYLGGATSSLVFSKGVRVVVLNTTAAGDAVQPSMLAIAQGIADNLP